MHLARITVCIAVYQHLYHDACAGIYRDAPLVASRFGSRYIGRDTIRVSPAQVSRCIDASMHRYTPNYQHLHNVYKPKQYNLVLEAAIRPATDN